MNEQETSSNSSSAVFKSQQQKDQLNNFDSNGSDSSSQQVKIIIDNHKNEPNNTTTNNDTNSTGSAESNDEVIKDETNNEVSTNEQRTSVIVKPSRIPVSTPEKKIEDNRRSPDRGPEEETKPRFLCESKLSQSVINNLFNSSKQHEQTANSNVKLRPSVLRIGESSSNEKAVDSTQSDDAPPTKEPKKDTTNECRKPMTNFFQFTPLTDKKPTFGSSISTSSSLMPTSSFGALSSKETASSSKSTFLNNNGDNKSQISSTTNYFSTNLFQQAAQSSSNNSPESSTFSLASNSESTGFVFGQNLQERVTNVSEKPKPAAANDSITSQSNDASVSTTDKNSTTAIASSSSGSTTTGVQEKRKFENITGEEEEINVIHIYCKLFHWNSESSAWKERGRGNLRLNDKYDKERTTSRLIMRTAGSYKLILNCLIISGMKFEMTNNCIRFSNVDGIYLVKGKPNDIELIYSLIQQRLKMLPKKSRAEMKQDEENDRSLENSFEIKEKLKLTRDDDEEESRDVSESNEEDKNEADDGSQEEETNNNDDDESDDEETKNQD